MTISVTEPLLVHPILTDEQALLVHQALIAFLNSEPGSLSEQELEEARIREKLSELVFFFSQVVEHPEQFKLRSRDDNMRIIRAARPIKGPAQPQSRRKPKSANKQKRSRAMKRAEALEWNEARERTEADMREAEEAYEEEKQRIINRFESIAGKETIRAEELQEVLELFGSPEAAERARELRADNDPQRRLEAAKERTASEGAGVDGA